MHKQAESFTYRSEIWADKAGYYVYLPALFIYDLDAKHLPSMFQQGSGGGFTITDDYRFRTKYSCGVALLQAPFFLLTHAYMKATGLEASGFSLPYQYTIDVAGLIYGLFGLLLLSVFLKRYLPPAIVYTTLLVLLTGTNLYYYMIADAGMSHIYSFFLFSAFMVLSAKVYTFHHRYFHYCLFGLVIGLIIAVRPLNIIFLPLFFLVRRESISEILKRIKATPLLYHMIIMLVAFTILIPQFLYWKYISGHFIYYGYTTESFSNLWPPKLMHFWFSTHNGLFLYTPIFALILLGLFFMGKENRLLRIGIGLYFIGISYLFSSWWCWYYGCSYGCRPIVEFYPLFALPLGFFLKKIAQNKLLKYGGGALLLLLIILNLKFIYNYDGCWYGTDWDLKEYINVLTK